MTLIALTLALMFTACELKAQPPEIYEGYQRIERDGFSFCIPKPWSTYSAESQMDVAYKDSNTSSNISIVKTHLTIKIKSCTKELLELQLKTAGMKVSELYLSFKKLNTKTLRL